MGALNGLLVIAIEQAVAAPICTQRLADAGARVIKIEREGGETARHYDNAVEGISAYFVWLNRGKESAVLNLKQDADRQIFRNMLKKADVLVQNLAPGALDRLGFTDDIIKTDFPKLIAVSILGYDQKSTYAEMRAYDMLVQAESGLCAVTGTPKEPSKVGVSVVDIATGLNAHAAILEAIIERGITGKGKQITISMFDGIADWMSVPLLHFEHQGKQTGRFGLSHASIYPYAPFACIDGAVIIAIQTQSEWERFCNDVLEKPKLTQREEFKNNSNRVKNRELLNKEIDVVFSTHTLSAMIKKLEQASIAFGKYNDIEGLSNHPALKRTAVVLPDGSETTLPKSAIHTSENAPSHIPELGQHTKFLKQEFSN